ncbi:hypothetical protein V8G54_026713 [Vigna mungo]|uniref:Uncharacterized protein n=1 Tax=Vigna mungo TaxID=3915 RepID=A0AAQ3N0J7_VIGMU
MSLYEQTDSVMHSFVEGNGLDVGGLYVNFDDNFGGGVCEQFSSKLFTLKAILWVVERLGLADGEHNIVFLRIINWPSLKLRSKKIEELFQKKNVRGRGNPIIRATLHLDEGAIPEHDVHEFGMSWKEFVMKINEDNQRRMVEMNKELRTLVVMGGTCGADVHGQVDDGEDDDGHVHGHRNIT